MRCWFAQRPLLTLSDPDRSRYLKEKKNKRCFLQFFSRDSRIRLWKWRKLKKWSWRKIMEFFCEKEIGIYILSGKKECDSVRSIRKGTKVYRGVEDFPRGTTTMHPRAKWQSSIDRPVNVTYELFNTRGHTYRCNRPRQTFVIETTFPPSPLFPSLF